MYKFFVVCLLFLACKPNNDPEKRRENSVDITACRDTFIHFSQQEKRHPYSNYLSFLQKPLNTLCQHFNAVPTDTVFLLEETHAIWRHNYHEADYNHISFIFGQDSAVNVWVSFIPHNNKFPADTNYFHHREHFRHITAQDFDFILTQPCYGLSVLQKDTIKYSYSLNEPMPIEDPLGLNPLDTSYNVIFCPKVRQMSPVFRACNEINYLLFLRNPVSRFLKTIEKKSAIQEMRLTCKHNTLAFMSCEMENATLSYRVVCYTRLITLPDIPNDTMIVLKGKEIPAFIQSHKGAFEEPVYYVTIYSNYKELRHFCEQSKIGK